MKVVMKLARDTHMSRARLVNAIGAVNGPRCNWSRRLFYYASIDDALAYYAIAGRFAQPRSRHSV